MLQLPKTLFALDLGTTKFCLAGLLRNKDKTYSLKTICVPAGGMHRGMLSDFKKAKAALETLIDKAEEEFNADIHKVVVGISGSHLKGLRKITELELESDVISAKDTQKILKSTEQHNILEGLELLHTIPLDYQIDSRPKIENPIGFSGNMLYCDYFLVYGDKYYLKDVVNLCNNCGLQVSNLYSEPFASSTVTIDDFAKQKGAVLADIGGGTTDCIIFQQGKPVDVFTINVAGLMMTNDLAIGLNLPRSEAEKIKITYGLFTKPGIEIKAMAYKGKDIVFSWKDIYKILGPRLQELASLFSLNLKNYKGRLEGGLYLTGGGSEIKGLEIYLHNLLKIPVKKINPFLNHPLLNKSQDKNQNDDFTNISYSTKYATILGLLNLEISRIYSNKTKEKSYGPTKYISSFVNWIKDMS